MKKFILSVIVLLSFGFYVIKQNSVNYSNNNLTTSIPTATIPAPVVVLPPKKTGMYNDGTYIGDVVGAYYGNVQVEAIISGGRLADVQFLDYPHDRGTSVRINSQAMPILIQEAIVAQSANVDGVSGASATSPAFIQSLSSALNQANA